MEYEAIIGLEVHMQLKTKSKMFCSCHIADENDAPNSVVCSICLGHPGTLPTLNQEAVNLGLKAATALHCKIPATSKFDRKHYFYPDLAKGYQISQFDEPIGKGGYVILENKKIRMNRIHLEEDVGKNTHVGNSTLIDFNRSGVPLAEMVTEPDIRTAEEAKLFLQELRATMRALGVSNADMEKGQMRCDANVSIRPVGEKKLYQKIELKNINSFKFVEKAIQSEIKRQIALWEAGTPPTRGETRGWDEPTGTTVSQRVKEEMHDYRYFPEPDIPPFSAKKMSKDIVLPELPQQKMERFIKEYCFSTGDAKMLAYDEAWGDFAENTMSELLEWVESSDKNIEIKLEQNKEESCKMLGVLAGNWMTNKLQEALSVRKIDIKIAKVTPENFAELMSLFFLKKINSSNAQKILNEMVETGGDPTHIMEDKGLGLVADKTIIIFAIKNVISNNPTQVAEYKKGKEALLPFFVGKVMKETEGNVDPVLTREMLKEELNK